LEIELRWNSIKYSKAEIQRRKPVFAQAKQTPIRFEGWLINFIAALQPPRAILKKSSYSSQSSSTDDLLKTFLPIPLGFRRDAEIYKAPISLLAFADLAAADLCWRAGNTKLGVQYLANALKIYKQNKDSMGTAICQMKQGDWLAAPYSTPLVWNFEIKESSIGGSELAWTIEKEEFNFDNLDLKNAHIAYTEAEKFFKEANATRGIANIQLRRGYTAFIEKNYPEAINYAQSAQDEFKRCGDWLGFWLAQVHRILSRVAAGQYPEEQATAAAIGKWGATKGSFSYTLGLGLFLARAGRHWLIREGDYERSIACFRLASALFRELGASTNLAGSQVDQAEIYRTLSDRTTALTFYEKAMDYYEACLKNPLTSNLNVNNYSIMVANTLYQLYQDEMNTEGMQRSANRMQTMVEKLSEQGNNLKSLSGLSTTFALTKFVQSTIEQAKVLVPLYRALAAQRQGNKSQAKIFFEEALKHAEKAHSEDKDYLEAIVLAHQKRYSGALEAFRRYLSSSDFTDQLAYMMGQLAGRKGQAEVHRQKERKLENAFSFMVRIRAYNEAKSYLNQLIELAGETWPMRNARPWEALSDWAEMYEGLKELENALSYYERAMDEFERRRIHLSRDELKTAIAGSKGVQHLYFNASRTAVKLAEEAKKRQDPESTNAFLKRAFEYSEKGRARALLDLMASGSDLAKTSFEESQNMRTWRRLNAQMMTWRNLLAHVKSKNQLDSSAGRIANLTEKIENLEEQLHDVESKLATSNPNFHRTINPQAQVMSLDEVRPLLPAGTAMIQYYFLGDAFLAWAITREGMVQFCRFHTDVNSLNWKIQNYYQACERQEDHKVIGLELSKIFLKRFARTLRRNSRIIFTPYGVSHILPFHTLPWDGQPLGVSHILSFLPNASTLQFLNMRRTDRLPLKMLAIGDPANMSHQLPLIDDKIFYTSLPAARVEASMVADLFPEGRVLIGDEATEDQVRKLCPQYQLLHFATHGYLSEIAPLFSSILLANGEALTVYELIGLNLKAHLVVLSACQTGLGERTGGGDVLGLARGLLGAGVQGAVVSLWSVNDLSTSLLMEEFYLQLCDKEKTSVKSVAKALKAAQNYLRTMSSEHAIKKVKSALKNLEKQRSRNPFGDNALSIKFQIDRVRSYLNDLEANEENDPGRKPFEHPFYWAAFVFFGGNAETTETSNGNN
jgi:CHAT domain-containing protein/TolA-binding protein